jgi:predicted MFS family arabinose efflux permease
MTRPESSRRARSIFLQLLITTPIRILLNTALRMVYPFLPEFSRGLGVSPETLTGFLAVRSGLGVSAPLFGLAPDRLGRRVSMLAGLVVFGAGFGLVALAPSFLTFGIAILCISIAKFLFDPALLAHLGDHTPYERRGLIVGLSEIGWSGATFVGIPALGLLIARGGWTAPFWPLAGLALLALLGIWRVIPPQPPAAQRSGARAIAWSAHIRQPAFLAAMSIAPLISIANEVLNVVYGGWLEKTFELNVAMLGLTTTVIGIAELAGEGAVAAFSDRLGKRRMVTLGAGLSALAYLLLPHLAASLPLALLGIFCVYLCFETTIVAAIPLLIELVPEARATVLSANAAIQSLGRMLGALLGGGLFSLGFVWTGVVAAALNVILVVVLLAFMRERR